MLKTINILNYEGFLKTEDRKKPISHQCDQSNISSNIDLTDEIVIKPYASDGKMTINQYSKDIAIFLTFWTQQVLPGLNGYSGHAHLKFKLEGTIV